MFRHLFTYLFIYLLPVYLHIYLLFTYTFLTPICEDNDSDDIDGDRTHPIDEHNVSGYCCYRVTDFVQYQTPPVVYSGPDVMKHFYEHIMSESEEIDRIIREQKPMTPLSPQELVEYRCTVCGNCAEGLTHQNYEVRHHCHISGDFLFAACKACNLQLQEAQLMLTTGSTRLAVSRGQQTWYHSTCNI